MPCSVRFTTRNQYNTLLCRISVDGVEGSLFSPTRKGSPPILVEGIWNQKQQKRTDRDSTDFNRMLRQIVTELETICDRQRKLPFQPTPKTVQIEFQTGVGPEHLIEKPKPPVNTILHIYRTHLITLASYRGTDNELSHSTLQKWNYGLTYLQTYLKLKGWLSISVDSISVGWMKDYHLWLMKAGPMAADSATRYVRKISEAIDAHIDHLPPNEQRTAFNPVASYRFGRAKTKEVYFLEKPHLERFWQLDNRGEAGKCIWYMGAIFLTGLDYPDLLRYLSDRARYDRPGSVRPYIEIHRSKPPRSLCRIPVWPELTALLGHIPPGPPPTADDINDYMKGVEVLTGFQHRLTCKIGRKTAGYIFLLRGYSIRAVSRILGQSSIAITERYYVKVTAELVQQEDEGLR